VRSGPGGARDQRCASVPASPGLQPGGPTLRVGAPVSATSPGKQKGPASLMTPGPGEPSRLHGPSVTSARDRTGYYPRTARNNPSLCVLGSNSVVSRSWHCQVWKSTAARPTRGASPSISTILDAGRFLGVHGILPESGRQSLRLIRGPVRPDCREQAIDGANRASHGDLSFADSVSVRE